MRRIHLVRTIVAGALAAVVCAGAAIAHPGIYHDLERLTAAIAQDPSNVGLLVERAYDYRLNQQYAEALADLDRARTIAPRDPRITVERGLTLSALGRDREAEAELTAFIEGGHANETALAERGKIRQRTGRSAKAVADYKAALAMKPDVELYLTCGTLQESLSDLAGASATYRDALTRIGQAVTIQLALIRVETARKRYDAALRLIDEELASAPVKTDWLLRRAEVLEAAGRRGEARIARARALEEANRVLAMNPSGIHLYTRAKVYAALGNTQDAMRDLELSLKKSPKFSEAGALLAQLRTVQNDTQRTTP